MIKLKDLKPNDQNPRTVSNVGFNSLVRKLKRFPEGLKGNPIKIDENNIIIGGNQRYKALLKLGYTEIPEEWVKIKQGWEKPQKVDFIIQDNKNAGSFDKEKMEMQYTDLEIKEYGIQFPEALDFDLLKDNKDIDEQMRSDEQNVMKSIHIEVNKDDYEEIYHSMNYARAQGMELGMDFVQYLKKKHENG